MPNVLWGGVWSAAGPGVVVVVVVLVSVVVGTAGSSPLEQAAPVATSRAPTTAARVQLARVARRADRTGELGVGASMRVRVSAGLVSGSGLVAASPRRRRARPLEASCESGMRG